MLTSAIWRRGATSSLRQALTPAVLPVILFLSVMGVYGATAEQESVNTDAYAASAGAWRIASTGEPWFDGMNVHELEGTHSPSVRGAWLLEAPNGHVVAHRMVGPIVAGVPFYWAANLGSHPEQFSLAPGAFTAAVLAAWTVLLVFLTLRACMAETIALAASIAFAFTTPIWSISANGLWTHSITQVGIAGAAFGASRGRWGVVGVWLAFGMLGRPHIALVAAVLGLGMSLSRRQFRPALLIAVPTAAALGLLILWNRLVFGAWSLGGAYGDRKLVQVAEGLNASGDDPNSQWLNYLGFFISLDRGVFIWTPVLLVLLPALMRSWRQLPDWTKWLLVGGIVYTAVQLRLNHFGGGTGFHGYRHGLELLTCAVPALGLSLPKAGLAARAVLPLVLGVQFGGTSFAAISEGYFVPLQRVWHDNSIWFAYRHQPVVMGTWLAVSFIGVAVLVTSVLRTSGAYRLDPRPPSVVPDGSDDLASSRPERPRPGPGSSR